MSDKYLQHCDKYPDDEEDEEGCGWFDHNIPIGMKFKYGDESQCPKCGLGLPKKRKRSMSTQFDRKYKGDY